MERALLDKMRLRQKPRRPPRGAFCANLAWPLSPASSSLTRLILRQSLGVSLAVDARWRRQVRETGAWRASSWVLNPKRPFRMESNLSRSAHHTTLLCPVTARHLARLWPPRATLLLGLLLHATSLSGR